jgi:flagellar hook-associated protein 1 FlgK
MGLNRILDIGMSGLYAASAALQTSSHNVANVDTAGFSRQAVTTGTRLPLSYSYGMLGGGADITSVRRLTDEFLVERLRGQTSTLQSDVQVDLTMQEIELVLGPASGNPIGTSLDTFFASWSELSSPPITDELRRDVLDKAELVSSQISGAAAGLADLESQMEQGLEGSVAALNQLLEGVSQLNGQILLAEGPGETANDLRDRRDYLMQEISQLTEVDTVTRGDGTLDVIIAGRTVVVRDSVDLLDVSRNSETGAVQVTAGNRDYAMDISGGEIGGLLTSISGELADTRAMLDDFAVELIDQVNAIHVQGRTAGGGGLMFFTGSDAASIGVNPQLESRPEMLATSRTGLAGDSDVAREIAALGAEAAGTSGSMGLSDRFSALITDVASSGSAARLKAESQAQTVDAISVRIESVRGVSLDEEAANMARYQNAYAASAKVVAAAQDMFDTILSIF